MKTHMLARVGLITACVIVSTGSGFAAVIEGSVKNTDGSPAAGAEIRMERTDRSAAPIVARADARGQYKQTNVDVGTYTVTATAAGGAKSTIANIKARTASAVRLEFDMRPTTESKKVRQWVYLEQPTGTHIGGKWVEVTDENIHEVSMQRVERKSGQALAELMRRERNSRP